LNSRFCRRQHRLLIAAANGGRDRHDESCRGRSAYWTARRLGPPSRLPLRRVPRSRSAHNASALHSIGSPDWLPPERLQPCSPGPRQPPIGPDVLCCQHRTGARRTNRHRPQRLPRTTKPAVQPEYVQDRARVHCHRSAAPQWCSRFRHPSST
jgi:hypothetical protein